MGVFLMFPLLFYVSVCAWWFLVLDLHMTPANPPVHTQPCSETYHECTDQPTMHPPSLSMRASIPHTSIQDTCCSFQGIELHIST